jgi:hypothetical protein
MNGMNGMNGTSGRRYHPASLFFALVDGLLILTGVLAGLSLRFWNLTWSNLDVQYLTLKITFFVLVVQLAFYYFDLYEFRCFREKKRMAVLLLESLGASSIVLAVLYYLIPHFVIGRGVFAVSALYCVLPFGTGDLAKKIKEEISDNAYDSFEILGFIDEHGEKVDQRIGEGIEERVAEERA